LDRTFVEAERDEVLRQADRYRYLILIAHGFADTYLPERYYLQFGGAGGEVLTTYDLYDLSLRAELTMALNCESAEGIATNFSGKKSIARALSYAGSRGVIAGRGVLPDQHTAEIVESFLTGFIDRRLTAAEALHEAKMTYRQQRPELGPFAWNGLVYYGDPDVRYSVGIGEQLSALSR
jgi:CHAT domain-containing protein